MKDLRELNTHLTALDTKIKEYDMERIGEAVGITKEVKQCFSEVEKEIDRSKERLDKQGQEASTPNEQVASDNTERSDDKTWASGGFAKHFSAELQQMESNYSLKLWKRYRCRRIFSRLKQDLGTKLDVLKCFTIQHSDNVELELLNELNEVREILLLLKEIISTDTSKANTPTSSTEQKEGTSERSRPLRNFTNTPVADERKEKALVSGKAKKTLPRWK